MTRLSKLLILFVMAVVSCQPSGQLMISEQRCVIVRQGLARATPKEVGLSSERLERIKKVMQGYVEENKAAGVVTMVARRGKVAHFESFGMMDIESKRPMQPDTIFRIYSMSKPVTSVAVMMLYEEGYFQISDPVSRFIPEFKDVKVFVRKTDSGVEVAEPRREITIRDLLTHTSGLAYGLSKETPVDEMYEEANIFSWDETIEEKVKRLVKLPLANQPGEKWKYSISVDVLGRVVEVISGKRFDKFLEERIFQPLGMDDSGFYVPDEKKGRFAVLYKVGEGGVLERYDRGKWNNFSSPTRLFSGGAGLVSTASDYMRFCQMLLNGGELDGVRILSRKTIELMTRNNLAEELLPYSGVESKGEGFGLGFAVIMNAGQRGTLCSEGAYSWGGAASTGFWVDPKEELIGIFMTQVMPYSGRFTEELKVITYQAVVD